nr:glycosyl transferase, family 14 [Tanacetum cinerariifolium]
MFTNVSFIDSFEDPGPHGSGRYSEHMLPEVEKKFFRKGAQPSELLMDLREVLPKIDLLEMGVQYEE